MKGTRDHNTVTAASCLRAPWRGCLLAPLSLPVALGLPTSHKAAESDDIRGVGVV